MAETISIELDQSIKDRVASLAAGRRRSAHWVMREAIEQYVDREEKRDAFHVDAIAAWEDYERTGLHATADEVDGWLEKLEAGEDAPPPQCHG